MASDKILQKRQKIEEHILTAAVPLIEDGTYSSYTVRALCAKINITTGMFYRHFRTKNDLLSLYAIQKQKHLYEEAKSVFEGKSLREQLLLICLLSMKANAFIGPDCIQIYLNIENPLCDWRVSQSLFEEQIFRIMQAAIPPERYNPVEVKAVCTYLVILQKGLGYE